MKTEQEIKEILSKYLYSIQDASLQAVVRKIIFSMSENMNWEEIYKVMCAQMPELLNEKLAIS